MICNSTISHLQRSVSRLLNSTQLQISFTAIVHQITSSRLNLDAVFCLLLNLLVLGSDEKYRFDKATREGNQMNGVYK